MSGVCVCFGLCGPEFHVVGPETAVADLRRSCALRRTQTKIAHILPWRRLPNWLLTPLHPLGKKHLRSRGRTVTGAVVHCLSESTGTRRRREVSYAPTLRHCLCVDTTHDPMRVSSQVMRRPSRPQYRRATPLSRTPCKSFRRKWRTQRTGERRPKMHRRDLKSWKSWRRKEVSRSR